MKFIKCDRPEEMKRRRKIRLVEKVANMHVHCLKVEDPEFGVYQKAKNFCASFNSAAKRINKPHIQAHIINGEVYIINDLVD